MASHVKGRKVLDTLWDLLQFQAVSLSSRILWFIPLQKLAGQALHN